MKNLFFALPLLILVACQSGSEKAKKATPVEDPHSFARPEQAQVKHLTLHLSVDFKTKELSGTATWEIDNSARGQEIVLDTRDLQISKVLADDQETTFQLGETKPYMGRPLTIRIRPATKSVTVFYKTSPQAAALQWLAPQQTAGKKKPYLFTQSQAVLARTWIPCQDSPSIRFTYEATVTVPKDLLALMSARNPVKKNGNGVYSFKQEKPIPSYLMALAVGDIVFKEVDARTGIYAEPAVVDKAAWEFADMGKMVAAAEKIYGPYQWERYDVLVLPPSFPFGGMENPMLTFATPTVIAGDRSLVSLIAHELAHSWSGNLVTNATWNDFWLNEGFTNYFERRILESLYGKDYAQMQELLGRQDLVGALETFGPENPDTRLKVDFTGRDPDEGVSDIAYEKGYSFIRTIEETVGRDRFDEFLKKYFETYEFRSLTTEEFLDYLNKNLIKDDKQVSDRININSWVYEPGLPSNIPPAVSANFTRIDTLLAEWRRTGNIDALQAPKYSTSELIYLIRKLPGDITMEQLNQLDTAFDFTESGNAEIQTAWYTVAIRNKYTKAYPKIENFLTQVGRRKFLMPLYEEMRKTPEGTKWAKEIYKEARPKYHSVAYNSLDELLR